MPRTVRIEPLNLDEQALRRHLAALGAPAAWQLQPVAGGWLLWLDESLDGARLCGALLGCGGVRRLDFAASAAQR